MRNAQRNQYARRIQAMEETGMSDHRPVKLTIRSKVRRRRKIPEKRTPQITHERLKNREVKEEYKRKVEEKWREAEGERSEEGTNWNNISEILTQSAFEVCGRKKRQVANPWTIDHEEELERLNEQIKTQVNERNRTAE